MANGPERGSGAAPLAGPSPSVRNGSCDAASKADTVTPNPNQNPYQVQSAPLKSKCTRFICSKTPSDAGPRL